MRSIFSAKIFLPLFIVAVVPEVLCVAIVNVAEDIALAGVTHITDLMQRRSIWRGAWAYIALVAFLAYYAVRAFAWGAIGALLQQRARGESRSAARALATARETFSVTIRTYTAFLIPLAIVQMVMAGLAGGCIGAGVSLGAAGVAGLFALSALGAMVLIPFWLWAAGFEYLLAPALAEGGASGLEAYHAMRTCARPSARHHRHRPLRFSRRHRRVYRRLVDGHRAAIEAGGEHRLAKSSSANRSIGARCYSRCRCTPDAWDWAHALVSALPGCLVFAFGAALAFSLLSPKET